MFAGPVLRVEYPVFQVREPRLLRLRVCLRVPAEREHGPTPPVWGRGVPRPHRAVHGPRPAPQQRRGRNRGGK